MMYGFEAMTFNIHGGYLEAIVRGYRSGLLTAADYNNLCQCETLDDIKMHLSATEYGPYLQNEPSPLHTTTIVEKCTLKLVDEYKHMLCQATEPLSTFLEYIICGHMIDNVVLIVTGTFHERDVQELLEKCHPLGMFDIAQNMRELYRLVLVDTPWLHTSLSVSHLSLKENATKRWTSSNQVLVEIACARSPYELLLAKQAYHARFKKSLEEDVAHHTTGDFRKLLVPLVSTYRYNGDEVNMTLAKSEAKILHENISKEHYSNEDLITILATRSKAQVNATLNQYKNEFGHDILEDLEADPNDECLSILRATVKCLTWPEKYFEKVLQLAINKRGKVGSNGCDRIWCCGGEVLLKNLPLKKKLAKFG
ncbi:unnamed protein product [Camellia sinensis]